MVAASGIQIAGPVDILLVHMERVLGTAAEMGVVVSPSSPQNKLSPSCLTLIEPQKFAADHLLLGRLSSPADPVGSGSKHLVQIQHFELFYLPRI
jgi:hypothetical protein